MNPIIDLKIRERLSIICEEHFLQLNNAALLNNKEGIEKLIEFINQNILKDSSEKDQLLSTRLLSLFNFINENNFFDLHDYTSKVENLFDDFEEIIDDYFYQLPEVQVEIQDKERFLKEDSDPQILKIKKTVKNISFKTSLKYTSIKAFIKRKNFQKEEFHWNRNIHFSYFINHFVLMPISKEAKVIWSSKAEKLIDERFNLFNEVVEIYKNYLKCEETSENYSLFESSLKKAIEKFQLSTKSIEEIINETSESINKKLSELMDAVEAVYPKAGTIDLSNKTYSLSKKNKVTRKNYKYFESKKKQIKNYVKAVSSNWISFCNFTSININQFYQLHINKKNLNEGIEENISRLVESFNSALREIIEDIKNSNDDVEATLKQKRKELNESLNLKVINELVHRIALDNPYIFIMKMEDSYFKQIENLPTEMIIVKNEKIGFQIREKDFQNINPKEIVESYLSVEVKDKLIKLKNEIDLEIKKISSRLIEIGQVIDYNLDTAISILENEDADSVEKAKSTAIEGIERSLSKSKNLYENYISLRDKSFNEAYNFIRISSTRLDALQNFENVLKIKLKVSKIKAEEKIKSSLNTAVKITRNAVPILSRKIRYVYNISKSKITHFGLKVGISEQRQALSVELTDFLLHTDEQIKKLPIVYQRIFSKNAVQDDRFIFGRNNEQNQIIHAYDFWKNNKKVSLVIIGEKGNGNSTVVVNAISKFTDPPKIISHEIRNTIRTEDELFKMISEKLGVQQSNNETELISSINNIPEKVVFVLENIEGLFLRIVNGFEPIKLFARIVISTNNKILWLCTCNVFSWNYLDKVVNISDYFLTVIKLENISKQEIQNVILKRHSISGYNIEFETPTHLEKKISNQSFLVQQELIKEEYFNDLNIISNGNLRLSHLFWLRSVSEFDGEKIKIKPLSDMRFSFLKKLDDIKFFILLAMILHDGVTLEECSKIFNMKICDAEMIISSMVDAGITVNTADGFKVNFLLYAGLIKILKDKNMIH